MNKALTILIFAAASFYFSMTLHAQGGTVNLSLEECLSMARQQSPSAIVARKTFESNAWNYRAFRASLKPQVILNANSPGFSRAIINNPQPDGSSLFVEQNQAFSAAELSISQSILPTGGTVTFSTALNRVDKFGNGGYTSWQSVPALFELSQPIFRYNELHWRQRIEPLRYDMATNQMNEALEDISLNAVDNFFNLYIAKMRLANEEINLKINDSIFRISEGRYRVGKIAQNELLQSELAYMNAQVSVENTRLEFRRAEMQLCILLGLPDGTVINPEAPGRLPLFEVSPEAAVDQAVRNRSDILQLQITQLQAESAVRQAKVGSHFNANIIGSYGFNNSGPTLSDAYSQSLDRQAVSVGFNIPLVQWGKAKAQIRSAEAMYEATIAQNNLTRRRLEQEVEFQVLEFMQLRQQLVISSKADTIAQSRFDVSKGRYLIGKIDITNLQIAQNEKDDARAAYYQMLKRYWTAYYALRRSTLYDFLKSQPIVAPEIQF